MLLDIYLGLHSAIEGEPVGPGFVPYKFPDEEALKLWVIGPCVDCSHKYKSDLFPSILYCDNENSERFNDNVKEGCIHFKDSKRYGVPGLRRVK